MTFPSYTESESIDDIDSDIGRFFREKNGLYGWDLRCRRLQNIKPPTKTVRSVSDTPTVIAIKKLFEGLDVEVAVTGDVDAAMVVEVNTIVEAGDEDKELDTEIDRVEVNKERKVCNSLNKLACWTKCHCPCQIELTSIQWQVRVRGHVNHRLIWKPIETVDDGTTTRTVSKEHTVHIAQVSGDNLTPM